MSTTTVAAAAAQHLQVFFGVMEDGQFHADDKDAFRRARNLLNGERVELRLGKFMPRRSVDQNAYFHGPIVRAMSEKTGYTVQECKDLLKEMFLTTVDEDGRKIVRETSGLNTSEMGDFIEHCLWWLADQLHVVVEDPYR